MIFPLISDNFIIRWHLLSSVVIWLFTKYPCIVSDRLPYEGAHELEFCHFTRSRVYEIPLFWNKKADIRRSFGDLLFPLFNAVKETKSTNMSQRNYFKYLESAKCLGFCGQFRLKYVTCWWNNVLRSSLSVIDGPGKWTIQCHIFPSLHAIFSL